MLLLPSGLILLACARSCFCNGDLWFGCLPVSICPRPSLPLCELPALCPASRHAWKAFVPDASRIWLVWPTCRQALPAAQRLLLRAVGAFLFCCCCSLVLFSSLVLAAASATVTSGLVVCRFQPARALPSRSASCRHSVQRRGTRGRHSCQTVCAFGWFGRPAGRRCLVRSGVSLGRLVPFSFVVAALLSYSPRLCSPLLLQR